MNQEIPIDAHEQGGAQQPAGVQPPAGATAKHLFIAFSNTADWHASEHPVESLHSYGDLVEWAIRQEVLTIEQGAALKALAGQRPQTASAVLARAIVLREAIYRIYSALGDGERPAAVDLASINQELAQGLSHLRVVADGGAFRWGWDGANQTLDAMLWPVARSAAEQLAAEDVGRVKVCADDRGCGYMFYDATRNRSRRWCDMGVCGNRAKAQRHYQRHRHDGE